MTTVDPRIDAGIQRLQATSSGREVGDYLATGEVDFQVLDDDAYTDRFPNTGGAFKPATQTIYLPASSLDADRFPTLLAHEGQHALDAPSRGAAFLPVMRSIGNGLVGLVTGPAQLRNPVTEAVDRAGRSSSEWELDAYERGANVARELGRVDSRIGQLETGEPRGRDEMRRLIAESPAYQLGPNQRLLHGVSAATFAMIGVGAVRHLALDGVLDGTTAGRIPVTTLTAATLGASLVVDQWKART